MTTTTLTLTDFLLARIAEDERLANEYPDLRGAWPPAWEVGLHFEEGVAMSLTVSSARVLAECAAKRRIVELAGQYARPEDVYDPGFNGGAHYVGYNALRDLAAVYADHADYREEWQL